MKVQRYLAPTAAPISWQRIGLAILALGRGPHVRADREAELKEYFAVKHAFLLSSGKAALTTIVRALASGSSRRNVIIPAYTCYSVPSAIVRAGCRVVLCDVSPHTLDFDYSDLERVVDGETLCVVAPHLLGQPVDIKRVQAVAQAFHVPVVEDAAQAMGGRCEGRWLGTQGDVGFFSLGRGKHVTAGSGGVILTNSDDLASRIRGVFDAVPESSLMSRVMNILMVAAMRLAIHPRLYWLPAGLPFLGLGETIFDRDYPIHKMDGIRAGLLAGWQDRLHISNAERADRASQYLDRLTTSQQRLEPACTKGVPYLRFPLLMPTADSKAAICALAKRQGLGVGSLYPAPISDIPELEGTLVPRRYEGARTLAERLVTLPVHHYVEGTDIERICQALQTVTEPISALGVGREQVLSTGARL